MEFLSCFLGIKNYGHFFRIEIFEKYDLIYVNGTRNLIVEFPKKLRKKRRFFPEIREGKFNSKKLQNFI